MAPNIVILRMDVYSRAVTISRHSCVIGAFDRDLPQRRYQQSAFPTSPSARCKKACTHEPASSCWDWARACALGQSPFAWYQSACRAGAKPGGGVRSRKESVNAFMSMKTIQYQYEDTGEARSSRSSLLFGLKSRPSIAQTNGPIKYWPTRQRISIAAKIALAFELHELAHWGFR